MSLQTEYAAIYSMVNDTIACLEGLTQLKPTFFENSFCQQAFEEIRELVERGSPVDETILKAKVKSREFSDSYDHFVKTANADATRFQAYYGAIKEKFHKRKAIDILSQGLDALSYENSDATQIVKDTEGKLINLVVDQSKTTFTSLEEEVKDIINDLQNPMDMEQPCITSGFKAFDDKVRINNGHLVVIAGRPSMGKTAWALHLATETAIKNENDILFFSVEMPKKQIVSRVISCYTGIPLWKIIGGKGFSQSDWDKFNKYESRLQRGKRCFQINDNAMVDATTIMAVCNREKIKNPNIKAIFVDYLQLMQKTDDLVLETTMMSRTFKQIARNLNIPVILLSQLSRKCEEREEKRPMLSDLRDSGSIEQDADIVMFLYRHYMYSKKDQDKNACEIIIAKQRNGETFTHHCGFDGNTQQYTEIPG